MARITDRRPGRRAADERAMAAELVRGLAHLQMAQVARAAGLPGLAPVIGRAPRFDVFEPRPYHLLRGPLPRVLYLGPMGFRPGVWNTRFTYIYPDLLAPVAERAEIRLLTGPVPDWARPGIEHLERTFGLTAVEIGPRPATMGVTEHWTAEAVRAGRLFRPDVITNVFGGVPLGPVAGIAAKALGARAVLRIAGDEIQSRLMIGTYSEGSEQHRIDLMHEMVGFNLADHVLVMSPDEAARVAARLVGGRERVEVCARGIDLARFRPADGFDAARPRRVFAFVGRRSAEKGYDLIEGAAAMLAERTPEVRLRFAGTFEPGVEGNREYVGFVAAGDLPAFYEGADAFVLCSRNEGFPQVVMEAMAMGRPCVLSRHIFETTFEDGRDALLVDAEPGAIAAAIERLARDPGLGARLARRGREIARARFSRERHAEVYAGAVLGRLMTRAWT